MKDFSIIVAMDKNRGIGKGGGLAWHLPLDLKHFKKVTVSESKGRKNAVIMGRKTWESIPERFRPLSDRLNVILTRNPDFSLPEGCLKCSSLEDAFNMLDQYSDIDQVFVIGGASIYDQGVKLPQCKKMYITMIREEFDCDVYFPQIFESFEKVSESDEIWENNCRFSFLEYERYS